MKHHFAQNGIYYIIGMIILVGIVVCFVAYRPIVGTELSDDNADWGDFGAFFWGFGTMCFTLLNTIVFYTISQRIYRRDLYTIYRDALNNLLTAYLPQNKGNNEDQLIMPTDEITKSLINMEGVLGGISESNSYNESVKKYAIDLMEDYKRLIQQGTQKEYREFISKLAGFQICLLNNHVAHSLKEYLNNKNVLQAQ